MKKAHLYFRAGSWWCLLPQLRSISVSGLTPASAYMLAVSIYIENMCPREKNLHVVRPYDPSTDPFAPRHVSR